MDRDTLKLVRVMESIVRDIRRGRVYGSRARQMTALLEGKTSSNDLPPGVEENLKAFISQIKDELKEDPSFIEYIEPLPHGEEFDDFITRTDRLIDMAYDPDHCPKIAAILMCVKSINDDDDYDSGDEYDWEGYYPGLYTKLTDKFCELWTAST